MDPFTRPERETFLFRHDGTLSRREMLSWGAAAGIAVVTGCSRPAPRPAGAVTAATAYFPGKVPMRLVNDRPPNLETPWEYFRHDFTPNDAFYVRWHLQFIPTSIDLRTWRLRVGGHVRRPLELRLDELQKMKQVTVAAVNQCSGNSRSLAEPRVPGAQWGNGAMGNARWTGVPLRDLLDQTGVRDGAVEVSFVGLDRGGYPKVPDFVKSLAVEKAMDANVLVALEINGQPLPMLNGFPARLIVPGWYGTYWVKALSEITVLPHHFDGFWMSKAYRIPVTAGGTEQPTHLATKTVPINRMNVRSFFVEPMPNARLSAGRACSVSGIAFDGGDGIRQVEVSPDAGATWHEAVLGPDWGRFAFRRWSWSWRPERSGRYRLCVRATSNSGETQPSQAGWNRSGYMRNVVEELPVEVG